VISLKKNIDLQKVIKLYENKMHIKDIAKKFDVPETTLRDRLYHAGYKLTRYRKFDKETLETAIKLYTCKVKGCNCKQIAKKLNVYKKTVMFNLEQAGIHIKSKKIKFTDKQIKDIITLYTVKKCSYTEIGRIYKVHNSVIKKLLENQKIPLRSRSEQMKYTTQRRLNGEKIQ
jgi:transposase